MLRPRTTTSDPSHLPKINPPNKAIGEPKPKKGNTHKIVNIKKLKDNKKRLVFFMFEKYLILSFINS